MIYSFVKEDGRRIGIDLANITDVEDCGNVRIINTVTAEYTVVDKYDDIVALINSYKASYITKFYVN